MQGMQHDIVIDPGLVAAKAYEIWQSLGCPEGASEQTWLEAERQLRARLSESQRETAPRMADTASESRVETHAAHDSEPPPASDRAANHDHDSGTMATPGAKTKKSATATKRTGTRR